MIVLAIETAMPVRSIALVTETGTLSSRILVAQSREDDPTLSSLDAVLRESGISLGSVDAIAVSIGPGMYTGLRVGVAVAKGLAFASDKPIVPVSTLEALAASAVALPGTTVWSLLDARRGEVYGAAFQRKDPRPERLIEDRVGIVEEVVSDPFGGACFVGPGAELYRDRLDKWTGGKAYLLEHTLCAESVGRLGLLQIREAPPPDPAAIVPIYLRPSASPPAGEDLSTGSRGVR